MPWRAVVLSAPRVAHKQPTHAHAPSRSWHRHSVPRWPGLLPPACLMFMHAGRPHVPRMHAGGVELRCTIEAAVFESALPLATGVRALMHAVRCPVTLARGAPRPQAPDAFLADAAAGLAAAAPDGVLRTFAGVGHFGPLSHPRAVARDVGRQLLRLDRCRLTPPQCASKL